MDNINNGVETSEQAPTHTGVETNSQNAPIENANNSVLLSQTLLELEKTRKERDNYKTGLLKAKGKLEDDTLSDEERFRVIAREEAMRTHESLLEDKEKGLTENIIKEYQETLKENKELKVALHTRATLPTANAGGSQNRTDEAIKSFFSPEQREALKKRNPLWTDEMVSQFEREQARSYGIII